MARPSFIQRIRTRLRNRYWQSAAGIAITLILAGGMWLSHSESPVSANPTMAEQLQHDDSPWRAQPARFSSFVDDVRADKVAEAISGNNQLYVTLKDGSHYAVYDGSGFVARQAYLFVASDATPTFQYSELKESDAISAGAAIDMTMRLLVIGLLLSVAWPTVSGRVMGYLRRNKHTPTTFDDVVGCGEAKQALLDIAMAQRYPERFTSLGARPPRGVLLTGSPGTGKTHLAKALATECGVNFIAATGSDFSSMFYGVGIMKVRSLFRQARRKAPCIILIDEIDGIGRRAAEPRMGEAEQNRIVNQFLTEMDGFSSAHGVLVIGATNLAESLDPALRREGRFDRTIAVPLPTLEDRKALLRLYLGKLKQVGEMDIDRLAGTCMGLTPAAIAALVNQAAIFAAREAASSIEEHHLVNAIETQRIGEKPMGVTPFTEQERRCIAVHEAGHALAAAQLKIGKVDKVTILPRGQALGVTLVIPTEDKRLHRKSELQNRIVMLLAGRAAEKLYFHEVSSGASSDLQEATRIALSMVSALGMGPHSDLATLSVMRDAGIEVDPTPTLLQVNALLREQEAICDGLLHEHRVAMDTVVARLLEAETIDGAEVYEALGLSAVRNSEREHAALEQAAYSEDSTLN
ncbi:AAA family ATPase [Pseudomonas sp. MWU16-30317]|uniref:AAA family ATPase n=1 Tax=Pseudomonas sp. MWU16-30317 TaxID=2878095 RepID=UPI001CFA1CE7|nr:AAA family ATPase [Pseudomonas sp. MWU16-30317]